MTQRDFKHPTIALLHQTRRRLFLQRCLHSLRIILLLSALSLLASTSYSVVSESHSETLLLLPLLFLCFFPLLALWHWTTLRSLRSTALYLEHNVPTLQSRLLSSLEFQQKPPQGSEAFIAQTIAECAQQASTISPQKLVSMHWKSKLSYASVASVTLAALALLLLPPQQLPALLTLEPTPSQDDAKPVVGDLRVRYQYPAYSKLPTQTLEGLRGDLSALTGTRAFLQTRALQDIKAAHIVVDGTQTNIPLRVSSQRDIEGELLLLQKGSYRVVVETTQGETLVGPSYKLLVEDDKAPQAKILAPQQELVLFPEDTLQIETAIEDDFGLQTLRLVFQVEGLSSPQSFDIVSFPETESRKRFQGTLRQPLADLKLREGDRVRYTVEAVDNDAVSGPKRGASAPQYFVIFSQKKLHEELLNRQDALIDALVLQLASRLEDLFLPILPGEEPVVLVLENDGPRIAQNLASIAEVGEKLMAEADALADAMKDDPLSHPEVSKVLRDAATHLQKQAKLDRTEAKQLRGLFSSETLSLVRLNKTRDLNEIGIALLEDDIVALEQLLNRQRAEELRSIAEDLASARARLKELIAEYKRTKDPALKEQIAREIERIEADLKRYQEKLASLRQQVNDEFYNQDALDSDEMKDNLSDVKDALAKNDLDAAEKALDKLSEDLDKLSEDLDENAERFADEQERAQDKALEELSTKLADLESQQRELQEDTKNINDRAKERVEAAQKKALEAAKKKAQETLSSLRDKLSKSGNEASEDSQRALKNAEAQASELEKAIAENSLEEASKSAKSLESSIDKLSKSLAKDISREEQRSDMYQKLSPLKNSQKSAAEAQKLASEIAKNLDKATPKPEDYLQGEERDELDRLSKEQAGLAEKLKDLQESMGKGLPTPKELKEAGSAMKDASSALGKPKPTQAQEKQGEVLKLLKGARDSMKQAMHQQGGKSQKQRRDDVKLPKAEEFAPPKSFRDEVIAGARDQDKAASKFKAPIKNYYEGLLK